MRRRVLGGRWLPAGRFHELSLNGSISEPTSTQADVAAGGGVAEWAEWGGEAGKMPGRALGSGPPSPPRCCRRCAACPLAFSSTHPRRAERVSDD